MARTIGLLISGGAVRLMSIGLALYVGSFVADYVMDVFTTVDAAMTVLPR